MKIVSIVGTRPQFIKAAVVSRAIRQYKNNNENGISEVLVHTDQHYDDEMSKIFFEDLKLPKPDYSLGVGSGRQGVQTGEMLSKIEAVLLKEAPDMVLVYGDCNSTLAGALAAKKLNITLAHVESGLRSFNRNMPEEINRIVTDAISDILFCPTPLSYENLVKEGNAISAEIVGDVMYDTTLLCAKEAASHQVIFDKLNIKEKAFILCTIHRAENTNSPEKLKSIIASLQEISEEFPVVLPLHPRTRAVMLQAGIIVPEGSRLIIIPPVGYFTMISLEMAAKLILTDSGGVQKEAFFHRTPCITMREETEWKETVDLGWNVIVGSDAMAIKAAFQHFIKHPPKKVENNPYGNGNAAEKIVNSLVNYYEKNCVNSTCVV